MRVIDLVFEAYSKTKEWQETRDQRLLTAEQECDLQYERLREMVSEDAKTELDFYLSTQNARAEHIAQRAINKGFMCAMQLNEETKQHDMKEELQ